MTPAAAVVRYLEAERVRGISEKTLNDAGIRLKDWLGFIAVREFEDVSGITTKDILDYLATVVEKQTARGNAVVYVREYVYAVKRFFAWAMKSGHLLNDPAAEINAPKVKTRLPRNILTIEEVTRLLNAPDTATPVGLRNRALIELLYSSGLRAEETSRLELSDVDMRERRVFIRQGKHGKDRVVPFGAEAGGWLKRYVEESRPLLEWDAAELGFFLSEHGARLTDAGLRIVFRSCREKAGIQKWVSPHSLRHTCATHLIQSGADIRYVQELLGHESVRTTQIYTQVAPRDLVEAHRKHHPRGGGEESPTP